MKEKIKNLYRVLVANPNCDTEASSVLKILFAVHSWSTEEKKKLFQLYKQWVEQHGSFQYGDIKKFINSIKKHFPLIEESRFYDTVRRQLYRILIEKDINWAGRGKRTLKETLADSVLIGYLKNLESLGYFIYEDGSVWYSNPPVVYQLPTIEHAIIHESKVVQQSPSPKRRQLGAQALKLLEKFKTEWLKTKSKAIYNPKSFLSEGYEVIPKADNTFIIKSPQGQTYSVDKEKGTCTCPAGQKGLTCKHLREVIYHY